MYYGFHGDGSRYCYPYSTGSGDLWYRSSADHDTGHNLTMNTWKSMEFYDFDWTNHRYKWKYNEALVGNNIYQKVSSSYDDQFALSGSSCDVYVDCFMVRKMVSSPATYAFGSEEVTGWSGKIIGISSPAGVMSIVVADIAKVMGI